MDVADEHKRLLRAYKKAEDLLHSLGIETGEGIDTTAVNELRYAGRHVLNGLDVADSEEREREFRRAEDHCERALYEAYDNAIFLLQIVRPVQVGLRTDPDNGDCGGLHRHRDIDA